MKALDMTHQGIMIFGNGSRLEIKYKLAMPGADGVRSGHVIGDLISVDQALLAGSIRLVCQDGLTLTTLITHQTASGATFVGTIAQNGHHVPGILAQLPASGGAWGGAAVHGPEQSS